MNKDFRPLYEDSSKNEFNVWDYTPIETTPRSSSDEQIEFTIECERLRDNARTQGYEEGIKQAQAEVEALKTELNAWLDFIKNPVQLLDKTLCQEMVNTIIWICQTCIGIELSITPEKMMVLMESIKKEFAGIRQNKQLAMNPEDIAWLKSQLSMRDQEITDILAEDPSLKRGDFYLTSEHSELDGTLKTRIENLFASYYAADSEGELAT